MVFAPLPFAPLPPLYNMHTLVTGRSQSTGRALGHWESNAVLGRVYAAEAQSKAQCFTSHHPRERVLVRGFVFFFATSAVRSEANARQRRTIRVFAGHHKTDGM